MKKKSTAIILIMIFLLGLTFALTSCKTENPTTTPTGAVVGNVPSGVIGAILNNSKNLTQKPSIPEKKADHNVSLIIRGVEGDIIDLNPAAEDPDGDEIEITFSPPFNERGIWKTEEGDAGEHITTIIASDGKLESEIRVLISIAPGNKAPKIECPEEIEVKEGDTIKLDCNIYDLEGDSVIVTYSGFMQSPVKKTGFDDAGEYTTIIQASDKHKTTTKRITIIVNNKNRAPVIQPIKDIEAIEDDVIIVKPEITDADGDELKIEFSEPLDRNGIWRTEDGDDGVYDAYVKASDKESVAIQRFKITVRNKNTAPVMKKIDDITVEEGELIKIKIDAYDPEGDALITTYSGWMSSNERQTTFDDAGNYTVQVTVSDGVLSASQVISITVIDKNRPPVFTRPG